MEADRNGSDEGNKCRDLLMTTRHIDQHVYGAPNLLQNIALRQKTYTHITVKNSAYCSSHVLASWCLLADHANSGL